jgi:hypothetical protein
MAHAQRRIREKQGENRMNRQKRVYTDQIAVGGLHRDDFEWASKEYEEAGYVLIGFVLDVDGYHWKGVHVKADLLEKNY